MRTATMNEYNSAKAEFISRHYGENGYREYSGVEGEVIYKELAFMDGANWYETTMPIWETEIIERHGIKTKVTIKYYQTEFWSTEQGSTYFYEAA